MSTSLLYHAFGVRGYRYVRTEYRKGRIVLVIDQEAHAWRCSACGSRDVQPKGRVRREFRTVPIGAKPVTLVFPVPRVRCQTCEAIRQVRVAFADPRRSYTHAFERYALELSRDMTIQDVAEHLGVGWDLIKDLQKRHLQRRFSRPKLGQLRRLAIDEIAVAKGRRYLTVVLDLDSGAVVFVGDGKGGEALTPFWTRLRRARAKIEAVATDLSPAYLDAVTTHLKDAVLVFDRFHVIKLYNDKLSDLRRALYRQLQDTLQKEVLKGARYLLLKRPENLDPTRNEPERLV